MPPIKGLDQSIILKRLIAECPQAPPELVSHAMGIILTQARQALAKGRPVTLRGFGRFIPRHYPASGQKKYGLVFRASPKLTGIVNPKKPDFPGP
jgi:nucleoid DNA-binding protein